MNGHALLEAAARAAGYKHKWCKDGLLIDAHCGPWNPLTDDGDALRLAVKLRMRVHHDGSCAVVELPTGQPEFDSLRRRIRAFPCKNKRLRLIRKTFVVARFDFLDITFHW